MGELRLIIQLVGSCDIFAKLTVSFMKGVVNLTNKMDIIKTIESNKENDPFGDILSLLMNMSGGININILDNESAILDVLSNDSFWNWSYWE